MILREQYLKLRYITVFMENDTEVRKRIEDLLRTQLFCVLSTNMKEDNFPYSSLIAFLHSDDLAYIYFTTARNTTKFTNLLSDPRVGLFFDNRSNNLEDVTGAVTATVLGKVEELEKEKNSIIVESFNTKYPQLKEFLSSNKTAFLRIEVEKYVVVYEFKRVLRLDMK